MCDDTALQVCSPIAFGLLLHDNQLIVLCLASPGRRTRPMRPDAAAARSSRYERYPSSRTASTRHALRQVVARAARARRASHACVDHHARAAAAHSGSFTL